MAKELVEVPAAKALFDKAADILGYDLLKVCVEGPKEKLDTTAVSQPAIYVASLAGTWPPRKQAPAPASTPAPAPALPVHLSLTRAHISLRHLCLCGPALPLQLWRSCAPLRARRLWTPSTWPPACPWASTPPWCSRAP